MTKKEKLHKLIDKFLQEKKKSTGGYAPVSQEEIDMLFIIISDIIALKYQEDPDGDVPVEFALVDRNQYERLHYLPVPYFHKADTEKKQLLALELAHMNVEVANSAFSRAISCFLYNRKDALNKLK